MKSLMERGLTMLREEMKQLTFYSSLYEKIPENHILRKIEEAVDFSFINEMLRERYCVNFGRPAKEPELMMKLLFLQYLYNLSDVRVIEEASYNLAYLWFLGLNPEDMLPDASLLAKFRTGRIGETTLDEMISEIVRQCVEKGIIKSESAISIDTTHCEANTIKKVPERIMKHLAQKIFKGLTIDLEKIPETINTEIPDYKQIENHQEAKEVMKEYLENLIVQAAPVGGVETNQAVAEAKEILADEKFILQKSIRSLVDKDARVGNKSRTSQFFGYKTEFTMMTEERIVTAVDVHSGEYVDGKEFEKLIDKTLTGGLTIAEMYGDKAYFRKEILEKLEKMNVKAYIPVSASVYKIDEELFSYNKDSDQWFCRMGNNTVTKERKKRMARGNPEETYVYTFDIKQCECCAHRDECMGKSKNKARKLQVALSAPIFYEYSQRQKQTEFVEKYKKRAAHEWKNAEMKRFHGMAKARSFGLRAFATQAKLTAITVNLKRIAGLISKKTALFISVAGFIVLYTNYSKTAISFAKS